MRLSFGFVRGDRLVCRYHGWNYDEAGTCCHVPARPKMKPSDKVAIPRHGAADRDGLLWVRLDGEEDGPPDLTPEGRFAFAQSIVLPRAAEDVAQHLRRVVFPLTGLSGEPQPWRATIETRDDESATVRWSSNDGDGHAVRYQCSEPQAGVYVIAAEASGFAPETRFLALQPQDETRSTLHIMVAGGDDNPKPLRHAAALWGRRLVWFLENDGREAESYNPWMPEAIAS